MELIDLIGEHVLSGVDMSNKSILQYGSTYENCEVVNFVLDSKTYSAIEDPSDGYRSAMSEIKVSDEPVSNMFEGQRVLAMMRKDDRHEKNDVLELFDVQTGKIVLQVGTENTDDYYPYWVAVFNPENMAINNK
jgi:hypothetical protein